MGGANAGWRFRLRIDLGVVHPDRAGSYLCGIECDGARYHSSATARDRDKVRQAVLEGLGWRIIRVWSTDWFRNADAVVERVHKQLEELLQVDREARASEEAEMRSESETPDVDEGLALVDERALLETIEHPKETPKTEQLGERSPFGVAESPSVGSPAHRFAHGTPEILDGAGHDHDPLVSEPNSSLDPDRFFAADYSSALRGLILRVVETEGPLTLHRLAQRVAQEHGWQRTGKRIQERVDQHLGAVECHPEFDTTFVWAPGTHAQRVPFRGAEARSIRDVSRAEIASVIDDHAGNLAGAQDPILALSRLLDISRLSKGARAYLEECVRWGEQETVSLVRDSGQRHESARNSSGGLVSFESDAAYRDWLARNRDGYVVNVRQAFSSDYVVLHRATCPHVSGPREPGAFTERDYRKLCGETLADVLEAPLRCGRARGAFTKRCSHCSP